MAAYKPKQRRVGSIRYFEPNPRQSQGRYIYQFYRLNKTLIDRAYSGIGVASAYEHFKQEAIDLLTESPRRSVKWATSYQLGKASFVVSSGGSTPYNNIIRMLRRVGGFQWLAELSGYRKSSSIDIENYNGWSYDSASQLFFYTPISPKTGRPLPNGHRVTIQIYQPGRYPVGNTTLLLWSDIGNAELAVPSFMEKIGADRFNYN